MILEQLVPTLELCQRAQKLGWKKATHFHWRLTSVFAGEGRTEDTYTLDVRNSNGFNEDEHPAPTLQEVLEELAKEDIEITYSQRIGAWHIAAEGLASSRNAVVEAALELWCELEEEKQKKKDWQDYLDWKHGRKEGE